MKKPIFIFGAGGLGREVLSLVTAIETWEPKGFLDDGVERGTMIKGLEVIGGVNIVPDLPSDAAIVLAIGDPETKVKLASAIRTQIQFPVLIHPAAIVQDPMSVMINEGTIICAGAVLTTNIYVGAHVLINLNVTVGHDSSIGAFSSIMPGVNVAGEVSLGDAVLLGAGCNIRNKVNIGHRVRVGMGAVVLSDVGENETVVGVPARRLESKRNQLNNPE